MNQIVFKISKDQLLCKEGDLDRELYKITEGKLLVCKVVGTMVTPIAYLEKGDYFGEMSFFDNMVRSANVIALEDSTLIKIPQAELKKQFPKWLIITAKSMTNRIRQMNSVIGASGIKRKNKDTIKGLTIEEQRFYYKIINN